VHFITKTIDQNKEYVINLEYITKVLGFTRKDTAKKILNKYLIENTDYKFLLRFLAEQKNIQKNKRGGSNKVLNGHIYRKSS